VVGSSIIINRSVRPAQAGVQRQAERQHVASLPPPFSGENNDRDRGVRRRRSSRGGSVPRGAPRPATDPRPCRPANPGPVHPSADQVCARLTAAMPAPSLTTVYRILEVGRSRQQRSDPPRSALPP
jgi:hypothetical protein